MPALPDLSFGFSLLFELPAATNPDHSMSHAASSNGISKIKSRPLRSSERRGENFPSHRYQSSEVLGLEAFRRPKKAHTLELPVRMQTFQGFDRGDGVAVLDTGNLDSLEARAPFDIAWRHILYTRNSSNFSPPSIQIVSANSYDRGR